MAIRAKAMTEQERNRLRNLAADDKLWTMLTSCRHDVCRIADNGELTESGDKELVEGVFSFAVWLMRDREAEMMVLGDSEKG